MIEKFPIPSIAVPFRWPNSESNAAVTARPPARRHAQEARPGTRAKQANRTAPARRTCKQSCHLRRAAATIKRRPIPNPPLSHLSSLLRSRREHGAAPLAASPPSLAGSTSQSTIFYDHPNPDAILKSNPSALKLYVFPPQPDAVTQPQIHSTDARGTDGDAEALDPAEQEAVKPSPPAATGPGRIRYRTPSSPDLLLPADADAKMRRYSALPGGRPETLADRVHRYRGVLLVVLAPLALVSLVLLLMPRSPAAFGGGRRWGPMGGAAGAKKYAVIFDAGSSGSRVHVFSFDGNLDLVHIGSEIELFVQKKPGLSAYAEDPREAALSLVSLLEDAKRVVPAELRDQTPVRVGATAGLRALGTEKSEQILQAVRDILREKSSFKTQPDWVTVLDGSQEGAYEWVTINYLLGNLGKTYTDTVGVVDLGGGSVQMAYAIPEKDAAKAPKPSDGEDSYVKKLFLKGTTYYLYVHSYLHYGLLAARAEILKAGNGNGYSNCILGGHQGQYKYSGDTFDASATPSGASYSKCRADAVKALKVDEACTHMKCSFGGIWNGGGGAGQKNLFVASFFFDRAAEAGFVNPKAAVAKVKPSDFEQAAERACKLSVNDAQSTYPGVQKDNIPYICMDLVYQYTLLVDGFGVDPHQEMTLVKKVPYSDAFVEAAWPLGSAIEVASSS